MEHLSKDALLIGAHTSTAGGLFRALLQGEEIGATTIQLFTSNQRQWKPRKLDDDQIGLWKEALDQTGLKKVMSHDSYLINLGSTNQEILHKSQETFKEEIIRCHALNISFLNFHPGAATTGHEEDCLNQIIASLKKMESLCQKGHTRLLFETTAGQGTSVGHKFEHLAYLIDQLHKHIPVGVCIDTCHIFAAGYDIRTPESWEKTIKEFDEIIGLNHLFAFHLNDSMKPLGSRRDRHAHLGKGMVGIDSFKYLMVHPKLREIPKYLETPGGSSEWKKEIELLRTFAKK
ncbi:MAG: deoxyribonuclease IV [Chlamydiae bacterium]|nr:deoxyribonuclease IV [Chlamydiota bacterium]